MLRSLSVCPRSCLKMLKFFILSCLIVVSYAVIGDKCTTISECSAGECCQILSQFMMVSKRRVDAISLLGASNEGTCQKYKLEGESCSSFEQINGYCGCGPGLGCRSHEVPIDSTARAIASSRSMVAPKPGYMWVSKCEVV